MSKIQKKPVALKLPKNIGAMHISNDLTLVERKIMNVILWNALYAEQQNLVLHHQDVSKKYYKITLKEIAEYIGWDDSNNIATIKDAIKKLVETSLQFNILSKQKTDNGKWNVITSLLGGAIFHDDGQNILYCFSDIIKDIILKPTLYGTLDFDLQQSISSKYTLALWEYLVGEIALNNQNCTTEYLTIEDYVKLIAGNQTNYTEFRKINEKLIKNPSQELIEKTNFLLVPEYLKEGRKVVAVRFDLQTTKKKPKEEGVILSTNQYNNLPSSGAKTSVNEILIDLGISEGKRKKYIGKHSEEYMLCNINYVKSKYGKTSNNIAGMIVKAIEENYANHGVAKTPTQQTLDLQEDKKIEYLNLQSAEPEFEAHLKRTLIEYFSPIHHRWIECIKIQSHSQELIVISLFNAKQVDTIEKNKDKFHNILSRECYNTFGKDIEYKLTFFIP